MLWLHILLASPAPLAALPALLRLAAAHAKALTTGELINCATPPVLQATMLKRPPKLAKLVPLAVLHVLP